MDSACNHERTFKILHIIEHVSAIIVYYFMPQLFGHLSIYVLGIAIPFYAIPVFPHFICIAQCWDVCAEGPCDSLLVSTCFSCFHRTTRSLVDRISITFYHSSLSTDTSYSGKHCLISCFRCVCYYWVLAAMLPHRSNLVQVLRSSRP